MKRAHSALSLSSESKLDDQTAKRPRLAPENIIQQSAIVSSIEKNEIGSQTRGLSKSVPQADLREIQDVIQKVTDPRLKLECIAIPLWLTKVAPPKPNYTQESVFMDVHERTYGHETKQIPGMCEQNIPHHSTFRNNSLDNSAPSIHGEFNYPQIF